MILTEFLISSPLMKIKQIGLDEFYNMNAHTSSVHKGHLWSFDINAFLQVVCRHYFYYLSLLRKEMH